MPDQDFDADLSGKFREWIAGDQFSCLAGRSVVRRGNLHTVILDEIGSPQCTRRLYATLERYVASIVSEDLSSLVAIYAKPQELTECKFETAFWAQLNDLHEIDRTSYAWSNEVDKDPESPNFAFSIAGHPLFPVGLHDGASRITRRFTHPAIAFNSHRQVWWLQRTGVYDRLQQSIRRREMRLQKSLNPNLAEFGTESEARQYSGSAAGAGWKCPFTGDVNT